MYKIGLTGGIGCGKSTVSDLFKQHGIAVIDADEIAHQLVVPGQKALQQIKMAFGEDYITSDGNLNRDLLRDCIFREQDKKLLLESIMHPLVYAQINQQLGQLNSLYTIISIPLLIKTDMQVQMDHILVIDCPMEMQINRVKLRNHLSDAQITAIINKQVDKSEYLAQADSVINNNQGLIYLRQQVDILHKQFLTQAQ